MKNSIFQNLVKNLVDGMVICGEIARENRG